MSDSVLMVGCSVVGCDGDVFQRGWCSPHWHRWQRYGDPEGRPAPRVKIERPPCSVDECGRPSKTRLWCSAHYERLRKTGDVQERVPVKDGTSPIGRYRLVTRHHHPLAGVDGRVREHRVVLYDSIGPGSHPCYWCGVEVAWERVFPDDVDALTVDHLDHDRSNNDLANLVVSCGGCNSHRWRKS